MNRSLGVCSHFCGLVSLALSLQAVTSWAIPEVQFNASGDTISCYEFLEVTLNVQNPVARNPFTDVTVKGSFSLNGASPVAVDGFCDSADGSLFRIRFMPSRPGTYTYTVKYREGVSEKTHQGTFQARDFRDFDNEFEK